MLPVAFALTSCNYLVGESEKLRFTKQENTSGVLRLDGYYSEIDTVDKYVYKSIVFFYKDGTLLDLGTYNQFDFSEKLITDPEILRKTKINPVCWGLYHLSKDSISFEQWYHSGGPPKVTYIKKGIVLNDTTFVITSAERSRGGEYYGENTVYHFRKFHPKPDSTNDFIK
jgi:hypothetical protein